MAQALRKIAADEFARRLHETTKQSDKRFALFLGAGCSVSSGVPDAASLVRDHWLPRLRDFRSPHRKDLDAWAKEVFPNYDPQSAAASYGDIMNELFLQAEERQREIESLCDGRFPGFGYACLSALAALEGGRFNVVVTTNFDDLVADALYLFTQARPLVIQHESLASFIRPTRTRPLVVKLHGDHRLSPQNTREETQSLKDEIEKQVRTLLHDRGLIFMGYGGNDVGIRTMLEALPAEALPLGIFWVSRSEPQGAIRPWLESRNAVWVQSADFDELMLLVRNAFDLSPPDRRRFDEVFEKYKATYETLSSRIVSRPETTPEDPALKEAVKRTDESFTDWWAVQLAASRLEKSAPDQAESVYANGLEQFPNSAPLLGNYAVFLQSIRKDHDKAEEYYQRAVQADPNHANHLGNYAVFLQTTRKDYDKAEEYYQRALQADPNDANHLGNYASFLKNIRKDSEKAKEYKRRASEAESRRADDFS